MKDVLKAIALSGIALATMPVHAAVITVTTLQDSLAGPSCSLRAAVQAASTDAVVGGCNAGEPGLDRIDLGPGVHRLTLTGANEDAGLTGDLDVSGDLQIVGSGAGTTFIEWDGAPNDRLLDVAAGATLEVSDLTLRRGLVAGRGGLVRVAGFELVGAGQQGLEDGLLGPVIVGPFQALARPDGILVGQRFLAFARGDIGQDGPQGQPPAPGEAQRQHPDRRSPPDPLGQPSSRRWRAGVRMPPGDQGGDRQRDRQGQGEGEHLAARAPTQPGQE